MYQVSKSVQAAEKKTCFQCTEQKGFWDATKSMCAEATAEGLISSPLECFTKEVIAMEHKPIIINNEAQYNKTNVTHVEMIEGDLKAFTLTNGWDKILIATLNCTSEKTTQFAYIGLSKDDKESDFKAIECGKPFDLVNGTSTALYVSSVDGVFVGDILIKSAYMLASGVAVAVASLANLVF